MALLMLSACGWEVPADPDAEPVLNVLSGEVVASGPDAGANTYLLLFDAADPPPPVGTGSPVTFASVPAAAWSGGDGMIGAPWALTHIPDGTWLVTALFDADGDFHPALGATAGATCGDWLGGHLADLVTGDFAPITLEGGEDRSDVPVVVARELTTERPAFTLGTPSVQQTDPDLQVVQLASTGVHSAIVELADPFDGTDPCGTMFLYYAEDADADGAPDPHPNPALAAGGALDVWPRIYLQYLGEELEPGESWAAEVVVDPTPLLSGAVTVGVPTPVTSLTGFWIPAAVHTLPDGTEETVTAPDLPAGAWSVSVVSITGQTWTVPNEVAAFPATVDGYDPGAQGAALLVE